MKNNFAAKFKAALKKAVDAEDYMKHEMELIKSGKRTQNQLDNAKQLRWIVITIGIIIFIAYFFVQYIWL